MNHTRVLPSAPFVAAFPSLPVHSSFFRFGAGCFCPFELQGCVPAGLYSTLQVVPSATPVPDAQRQL